MIPKRDGGVGGLALVRAVLREPLTHFLLVGAVLAAGAAGLKALERPVLNVDLGELEQLAAYWQIQTQRPPTRDELNGMIRERVDEEILAREAVRLGLDKDDLIIRRRLAQKMAFAGEDLAPISEPDDKALRDWFRRYPQSYASPSELTFKHIYFSDNRPGGGGRAAAETALRRDKIGPRTGDPFVLPNRYERVTRTDVLRDYGPSFVDAAMAAPVGQWMGPVRSAYGWHLIKVEARQPGRPMPFEKVRTQVRTDYIRDRRTAANAAFMDRLRARYIIKVAPAPAELH